MIRKNKDSKTVRGYYMRRNMYIIFLLLLFICLFILKNDFKTFADTNSIDKDAFPSSLINDNIIPDPSNSQGFKDVLDNTTKFLTIGRDSNGQKYIEFQYGGFKNNSREPRNINFQIEFNPKFRNNGKVIDGPNSYVQYNDDKKQLTPKNGENSNNILDKYVNQNIFQNTSNTQDINNNIVYSYSVSTTKITSPITTKIYLKPNINEQNMQKTDPLLYIYYGYSNDDNSSYFNMANAITFGDLIKYVQNNKQAEKDNIINNDVSKLEFDTDKNQVISKLNKNLANINSINSISNLVDKFNESLKSGVNLLNLRNVPNLIFNNTSTNDATSTLNDETLSKKIIVSNFNNNNWSMTLSLSSLTNALNNNITLNPDFFIDGQRYKTQTAINFINSGENAQDGSTQESLKNIQINFDKGVMPSGTYNGTATWDLSPNLSDNGIKIN